MKPDVADLTDAWYRSLGSGVTSGDPDTGWQLLRWLDAAGRLLVDVDDLAGDGWARPLDVARAHPTELRYLAQFLGVRLPGDVPPAVARNLIEHRQGFQRGTPATLLAAATVGLRGEQRRFLTERDGGSAYRARLVVYDSEVVDLPALTAAVQAATPAGIVVVVDVLTGASYAQLAADFPVSYAELGWSFTPPATYTVLGDDFPTYSALTAGLATYADATAHRYAEHQGVFDTYADMTAYLPGDA